MKEFDMKIENYYLNLDKVNTLLKEDKEQIHKYYQDMMYFFNDGRTSMAQCLFNTLFNHDYLVDIRDEKINKVLS
jgi:hypothetical protein